MAVIIILIVFSLIVAIVFLAAFVWSVKSGQFEDTVSPSIRILFEEKGAKNKKQDSTKGKNQH